MLRSAAVLRASRTRSSASIRPATYIVVTDVGAQCLDDRIAAGDDLRRCLPRAGPARAARGTALRAWPRRIPGLGAPGLPPPRLAAPRLLRGRVVTALGRLGRGSLALQPFSALAARTDTRALAGLSYRSAPL